MPRYAHDITDLLSPEDVRKLYDAAKSPREQVLVCLLWITGARPSELLELTTEAITLTKADEETGAPATVSFVLPTKKLQADGTKFVLKTRQLRMARPEGLEMNIYLETIIDYLKRLRPGDRVMSYTRRWAEKIINRLGRDALGKQLSPYHFRHSAIMRESAAGRTLDQLMHYKGAKSVDSVKPYLHARAYDIILPTTKKGAVV